MDKLQEIREFKEYGGFVDNPNSDDVNDALDYLFDIIKQLTEERDYWEGYGEASLRLEEKFIDERKTLEAKAIQAEQINETLAKHLTDEVGLHAKTTVRALKAEQERDEIVKQAIDLKARAIQAEQDRDALQRQNTSLRHTEANAVQQYGTLREERDALLEGLKDADKAFANVRELLRGDFNEKYDEIVEAIMTPMFAARSIIAKIKEMGY